MERHISLLIVRGQRATSTYQIKPVIKLHVYSRITRSSSSIVHGSIDTFAQQNYIYIYYKFLNLEKA